MDLQQYLADISLKTMSQLHRAIVHLTGGQVLGSAFGMPVVELHTVGRKSGQPRSTMLTAPVIEGDRVVLVASKGGDDRDPDWYRNLIAQPDIELTMAGAPADAGPPGVTAREGGAVAPGGGRLHRLRQLPAPHRTRHPAGHLRAALNAHRDSRLPLLYAGAAQPALCLADPLTGESAARQNDHTEASRFSVGLAALSLARDWNLTTIATTRNLAKTALLIERGADDVLVDTGEDAFEGLAADYVLDLIGAHSALGSLHLVKPGGTVCVVGMLSYDWVIEAFEPVTMIPSGAKLTTFHSEDLQGAAGRAPLARIVRGVERGAYHANVDRVFTLDQIADAHRYMEANQATGKVVIQP